eukprot:6178892-Pleurochrysis_carterae.AAC.3
MPIPCAPQLYFASGICGCVGTVNSQLYESRVIASFARKTWRSWEMPILALQLNHLAVHADFLVVHFMHASQYIENNIANQLCNGHVPASTASTKE